MQTEKGDKMNKMNKKNIIKIILDIAMAVLFITFFNKELFGFRFHIIGGRLFALFIAVHMVLNIKWIVNITKRLFDKKLNIRIKISYIVSLLLLISIGFIIGSGVLMMKAPNYDRMMFWKMTHFGASYLSVALIGLHLGIYWTFVMNMFKKIFKIKSGNKNNQLIARICTVIILVFGLTTIYNDGYLAKLSGTLGYSIQHIQPQNIVEPEGGSSYQKEFVPFTNLAITYGSIISVFAIGSYYGDNYLKNKNKKKVKEIKAVEAS